MTKREKYTGVAGIDLGTTLSLATIWDNETKSVKVLPSETGSKLVPSCVAFTDDGERLVGESAKRYGMCAGNQDKYFYETKRLIGKLLSEVDSADFNFKICGDQYDKVMVVLPNGHKMYPEEISGAILCKMKTILETNLNMDVENVVITVPAYFNNAQRTATKNAAKIAGLNCIGMINEPTSACLYFGLHKKEALQIIIYDLGGGTCDVSLIILRNGLFQVIGVGGDCNLGGKDFDQIIATYLAETFKKKTGLTIPETHLNKLKGVAENTKKDLSYMLSTIVDMDFCGVSCSIRITRLEFETITKELFEKCIEPVKQVLSDSKISLSPSDIDEIIMVGGSSRIPKIQQMISTFFSGKHLNTSVNADEIVACGASIHGTILGEYDTTGTTGDLTLIDVIPLSIGLKLRNGLYDVLIPKNSSIPTSKVKIYTTSDNNQSFIDIEIYEGERPFVKDNHHLGTFRLTDLPKMEKGKLKIDVTFNINEDGILTVSAVTDSNQSSLTINTHESCLSQDDVVRMIESADKYRLRDRVALQQLELTKDLELYVDGQRYLINSPDANLDQNIISNANQKLLQTIEWLYTPDTLTDELPSPEAIIQCKEALKYHMDQIPWTHAYSHVLKNKSTDDNNYEPSIDDINQMLLQI